MQKLPIVLLAILGLFALSEARSRATPQEMAVLAEKSSDYVTRINSTDIPYLLPGSYMVQFLDKCPGNPMFDNDNQLFFVYLPKNFNVHTNVSLGIVVFISHTNQWGMWSLYNDIFERRNLIYVVPQNVGNMVEDAQRHAAGAAAIYYFQSVLPLDPTRIYASGLSGGARIACQMGFDNGTWISGVVGIVGCDYKRRVVIDSTADPSYGFYDSYPLPDDVLAATFRVAIITGSNDFCETNLKNIYYNGILEDGLTGILIDVPGMGHEMADFNTYDQALGYLDNNPPKCQFPCKNCTAGRRDDCTACFSSLSMSLYINETTRVGSCLEFCPSGKYAYDSVCVDTCPEGTVASNDGNQDICTGTSTEEKSE